MKITNISYLSDKYRHKFVIYLFFTCLIFILFFAEIIVLLLLKDKINIDFTSFKDLFENHLLIVLSLAILDLLFDLFLILCIINFIKYNKANNEINNQDER